MQLDFKNDDIIKIDLEDGDFVDIKQLSYEDFIEFAANVDADNPMTGLKKAKPLLKAAIVGWNLKNAKGEPIEYSPEVIDKLNTNSIFELFKTIVPRIFESSETQKKSLKK